VRFFLPHHVPFKRIFCFIKFDLEPLTYTGCLKKCHTRKQKNSLDPKIQTSGRTKQIFYVKRVAFYFRTHYTFYIPQLKNFHTYSTFTTIFTVYPKPSKNISYSTNTHHNASTPFYFWRPPRNWGPTTWGEVGSENLTFHFTCKFYAWIVQERGESCERPKNSYYIREGIDSSQLSWWIFGVPRSGDLMWRLLV
jgi:hypothetical protein